MLGQFLNGDRRRQDRLPGRRPGVYRCRLLRLAQSPSHRVLHPNPPRHESVADNRGLVTGTQLLQKSASLDLVYLDRGASRLRPLAVGQRHALALRGLLDRSVESSGSSFDRLRRHWRSTGVGGKSKCSSRRLNREASILKRPVCERLGAWRRYAVCWRSRFAGLGTWGLGGTRSNRLRSRRIRDPPKVCFATDSTVFAKPSSMRQTNGSRLSVS